MTTVLEGQTRRGRGRPPLMDRGQALDQAMKLFWDRGYEGASFDELVAVMGIGASSFYNAFGSKERLFQEAVQHYLKDAGAVFHPPLASAADARTSIVNLLDGLAQAFTRDEFPNGCMVCLAGLQSAPNLIGVRDAMRHLREEAHVALRDRLSLGVANGDVPIHADVEGLAGFYESVCWGMAVKARDGASRAELQAIGRIAINAWPAS